MRHDAEELTYQEVTILGKPALFTECRIDRTTMPEGVYHYEVHHADEDWGEPITLSRGIVVNYNACRGYSGVARRPVGCE